MTCYGCGGTGQCHNCNGTGTAQAGKCVQCDGAGGCQLCNPRGHIAPELLRRSPFGTSSPEFTNVNPGAMFIQRLAAVTPTLFVAYPLIASNIVAFLFVVIRGVDFFAPTSSTLILAGANFGPRTLSDGQWWRLLTSIFLHVGIVHLAFNMLVLFRIGPFVERSIGNLGFLLAYPGFRMVVPGRPFPRRLFDRNNP
jgi:rhomboid protease GluP